MSKMRTLRWDLTPGFERGMEVEIVAQMSSPYARWQIRNHLGQKTWIDHSECLDDPLSQEEIDAAIASIQRVTPRDAPDAVPRSKTPRSSPIQGVENVVRLLTHLRPCRECGRHILVMIDNEDGPKNCTEHN